MDVFIVFQADELLQKLRTAAVQDIKKDYGKNPDVTGLWNTTMTTVQISSSTERLERCDLSSHDV